MHPRAASTFNAELHDARQKVPLQCVRNPAHEFEESCSNLKKFACVASLAVVPFLIAVCVLWSLLALGKVRGDGERRDMRALCLGEYEQSVFAT